MSTPKGAASQNRQQIITTYPRSKKRKRQKITRFSRTSSLKSRGSSFRFGDFDIRQYLADEFEKQRNFGGNCNLFAF
jgi:hypothetical protein